MTNVSYIAAKGSSALSSKQFYIPIVQCERTVGVKEGLALFSSRLGYQAAKIRAVFLALDKVVSKNHDRGVFSTYDNVVSFRIVSRGAFANITGPWVKGINQLVATTRVLEPFKSVFSGIVPKNVSDGVKPVIDTIMDVASGEYGLIVGSNTFRVAGFNLAINADVEDEYVALRAADGTLIKTEILTSDIGIVEAHLTSPIEAGSYTLVIHTRAGYGRECAVAEVTRKITVK